MKTLPPKQISVIYFLSALAYTILLIFLIPWLRGRYQRNAFFDTPPAVGSIDIQNKEDDASEKNSVDQKEEPVEASNPLQASNAAAVLEGEGKNEKGDNPEILSEEKVLQDDGKLESAENNPMHSFGEEATVEEGVDEGSVQISKNSASRQSLNIETADEAENSLSKHRPSVSPATRDSNMNDRESMMGRLSIEGHVVFDPLLHNANLPSGDLPHNPGRRIDRHLRESIRQKQKTQVEDSLTKGAMPYLRSTMAYTIVQEAIAAGVSEGFLLMLIQKYPRLVNTQSSHGTTPLMLSIALNRMDLARLLLQHGANINAQNDQGQTPLMLGAMRNIPWAAMFLVPWGADPELVDIDGRRAVDLALLFGNARVASDLQGSAMAVVPGYIAPKVQNNYDGLSLIYTIAWHGFDVATDVLLAINLSRSGHPILAIFTMLFLLLPSFFIFMIPYQTIAERLLTLLQMRIVYEGLISMGQERLTVRFGATRMYHTVLQNVPQTILQSFMLALVIQGENNFGGDKLALGLAIATTIYQTTTTFHNMYLMRFFTRNNDSGTEKLWLRIFLIVGVLLGVALRIAMWASVVLLFPKVAWFLFAWVFITRFRLIGTGLELQPDKTSRERLELTIVDLFVTFLSDVPYITVPSCYFASFLLSILELIVVLAPSFARWHQYQAVNGLITCFWLWVTFTIGLAMKIHGTHCTLPNGAFWRRYFAPHNLLFQIIGLIQLAINNMVFSVTFLYLEAKAAFGSWFQSNDENNSTATKKRRKKRSGPVAPPMLRERWYKSLCKCPTLHWKALETREKMSMFLIVIMLLLLLCYLVSLMGHCHQVSDQLWYDDDARNYIVDDVNNDDRSNTYQGIKCQEGFNCTFGFFGIAVAPYAICLFVLAYFIEAVTCSLAISLRNLSSEEQAYNKYLQARSYAPSFYWYSEAYHYETRTYTTTESDGNGGTRTVTRTETVKVVTHTASMYYAFDYWIDNSSAFPQGETLCRIQSNNLYEFDKYTQQDFDNRFATFKRENDTDTHQNCTSTFMIGGTTSNVLPTMLIYAQAAPYFLRYTYYLCSILVLLAPWYRWNVASISTKRDVPIIKKVRKLNPEEPQEDILLRYGSPEMDAKVQLPVEDADYEESDDNGEV